MYFVYILKSLKNGRYYIGCTSDISKRIDAHNRGSNCSTKAGRPWKLIFSEQYISRKDAYYREKKVKSYKGGEAFKNLIKDCI